MTTAARSAQSKTSSILALRLRRHSLTLSRRRPALALRLHQPSAAIARMEPARTTVATAAAGTEATLAPAERTIRTSSSRRETAARAVVALATHSRPLPLRQARLPVARAALALIRAVTAASGTHLTLKPAVHMIPICSQPTSSAALAAAALAQPVVVTPESASVAQPPTRPATAARGMTTTLTTAMPTTRVLSVPQANAAPAVAVSAQRRPPLNAWT